MGKFEKLVVLAVLFAAALVLAISFNRGGEVEGADPLSSARDVLEQGLLEQGELSGASSAPALSDSQRSTPDEGMAVHEQAPSLLLNAGSETASESGRSPQDAAASLRSQASDEALDEAALSLEPVSDPTRPVLVDTSALRPSFLDEYRMYTVAEGDTWSGLAQRFYRDERYTRNLHLANEDLDELTPGKEILVPVYDFLSIDAGLRAGGDSVATSRPSFSAAPAATPAHAGPAKPSAEKPSLPTSGNAKPLEYEVRSGDTLSDISLVVFGTATRWQEILDANADRLQKPEALRVGMKLRIPAGGKLPGAKPTPKKAEAKPKTAQAEKAAAPTKKKKVL